MGREAPPHGTYAPGWPVRILLALSQNTLLGRGRARKLMARWTRMLSKNEIDTRLFGKDVRLHLHNNSSEIKALMNPRRYSRSEFAFSRKYLPDTDPVFVDIGANAGLFSVGMIGHMTSGTLIAIEPQPRLFDRLSLNLTSFNSDQNPGPAVSLFQIALGRQTGELVLNVPEQLGQASARTLADAEQIKVTAKPLLALLQETDVSHVDVLKIDVEGFEDEILVPFFEAAPDLFWPHAIVLEHCHRDRWERDCESALITFGYEVAHRDRTNILMLRGERRHD